MTVFNIHAGCVAYKKETGILIVGASCSGKSRLALHVLDNPDYRLVSDDRTLLQQVGDTWVARAHPMLQGVLHDREHGFLRLPFQRTVAVKHVISLFKNLEEGQCVLGKDIWIRLHNACFFKHS
jgi:serine kinase of HPr protein (carbohydrate metabolism regulator)